MNLGITTSFIIGGLLLIAILNLNNMVMQESTKTTMNLINGGHVDALRQIISQDFSRMGFKPGDLSNSNPTIASFNPPHKINFFADVYGNGGQIIKWQFLENQQVQSTVNPNDRILQRNGPFDDTNNSRQSRFTVVDFKLTGYADTKGETVTTNKSEVKSIEVEVIYESPEPVGTDSEGNPQYSRSIWRKLFVPSNMQFKTVNAK